MSGVRGKLVSRPSKGWVHSADYQREQRRSQQNSQENSSDEADVKKPGADNDGSAIRELHTGESSGSGIMNDGNGGEPRNERIEDIMVYKVYKRRWIGLAQLVLLNLVVSWDVSLSVYCFARISPATCQIEGFRIMDIADLAV
jgi:hypothetical protein